MVDKAVRAKRTILIVDDEPNAIKVLSAILTEEGYQVFEARDVNSACVLIADKEPDAIITDVKMPGMDGIEFFESIHQAHPDIPIIFLTAYGSIDSAVHAITRGAFYYFIKPPDYQKLKVILARAVEQRLTKTQHEGFANRTEPLTGITSQIKGIFETIEAVKDSASTVLIIGETGTGKELISRALHEGSIRKNRPFVAVNCAAIPRELIESELFGYEKGAFSGAVSRRIGRFEEVGEGTLFLDEIGELELSLQAKLLRVLQEKEVERLGSNKKIKVNFRLVTSTNRNLQEEIYAGNFREDLFYRLNVVLINVPPLRERKDDIPLLSAEFIKEFCARERKMVTISTDVMDIFQNYCWPGNIRQLRNIIERAVVLAKGKKITLRELPTEFLALAGAKKQAPAGRTLRELELTAVKEAIEECKGNKSRAAELLGISRKALYKRLQSTQLLS